MDFGDILDSWEKEQKGSNNTKNKTTGQEWRNKKTEPQKKSASNTKIQEDEIRLQNKQQINPMEMWLRRYGVVDKDKIEEKAKEAEQALSRSDLRKKAPDAVIDLHGLTRDEAWVKLEAFVTECVRRKLEKILIIHGKGNHSDDNPVLSGMVRTFIEKDHRLGESGHPEKKDGGKGATWVIIRL